MKIILDVPEFDGTDLATLQETLRRRPVHFSWGREASENDGLEIRAVEAVASDENAGLVWVEPVTEDVRLAVDETGTPVLVTADGKTGPRWAIRNLEDLAGVVAGTMAYLKVRAAVMADWKDRPEQGEAILAALQHRMH